MKIDALKVVGFEPTSDTTAELTEGALRIVATVNGYGFDYEVFDGGKSVLVGGAIPEYFLRARTPGTWRKLVTESKIRSASHGAWMDSLQDLDAALALKPHGFEPTTTGGGCTALQKDLPGGAYLLVTGSESDAAIPEKGEGCVVGLYDSDGDPVHGWENEDSMWTFESMEALIAALPSRFWERARS